MKHRLFAPLAAAFIALSALVPGAGLAVNPDEVLADPALEARARDISAGLRCVVCRGENIDESNAGIARDLRLLVRERLVAGDVVRRLLSGDEHVLIQLADRHSDG